MNKYILSLLFIFSAYSSSFAQVFSGAEANELMPNAQKIWIAENAQTIKYIAFTQPEFVKTENHSDWLRSLMKGSDKVNFKLKNTTKDNLGQVHYRYDQYFMNYRVVGAQYILHTQNGKILSSNGDYVDTENVKLNSNFILKSEAEIIAKKSVLANEYAPKQSENLKKNEGQIVLLRIDNTLRFAYKIDVYATKPLARFYVYVDALSKKVLKKENRIHDTSTDGTAETMYHGTQSIKTDSASANHFVLVDSVNKVFTKNIQNTTNINAATNFVNNSNYWNNTTNNDNAAHDAHWGSTKTLEYFLTRFGLNSYDGNGTSLNSYIHYDNNYNNAFWDGASIFFGDGDNVKYSPLTSIDVVAHEITHAITENSADLVYNSESGALNESFSDIFGTALEFAVSPNSANWNMGDLFDLNGNGGFRNISDPKSKGDPDTYKRINWHTGSSDNYGVHTNSGVQNYWFYLLTEGGTGINDYLNNYDVVGIGMNDATSIAYRNLSVYLTYNSQYADAQFYAIQAAIDLFGICSQQVKSTRDAWYAVGLGSAPNNNVYSQFEVLQTNYCSSTATVSFINNSINDTARTWYFGDGNTSTALNPTHTYSSTGIYDVMLVSYGSSNCGTEIDSFSISNFINVTNNSAPIPAYCTPIDTGSTSFSSILNFTFNTINNNSVASKKIYEDYTCGHQTTVTEGEFINLELLATNEYKNVSVYIDYNNDGIFSNNEKIFSDASWGNYYQENIQIQNAAVLNTVLRLRVVLSRSYNDSTCIFGNATHYKRSQVEDYGITILPISSKPEISFYAQDTIIPLGSSVGFINESTGLPSFFWNFINGFPNTSNDTIPNILYNTLGLHNVELIATNSFGADTLLKTDYIEVVNDYRMCDTTNIEDLSGILYDDGGPLGNYSSSICTFVIEPPCADSIILSFLEFDMKSNSGLFQDDVSVYDGVNLIYRASRDDLPPEAIATSGRMIIVIDGTGAFYGSDDGFVARWRTIQQTQTIPVADFSFSNNNPAINEVVTFTDLSTENPSSWEWIFNNTDTVKTQNPEYSFSTAGINTIQLIASTCGFSDTIIKTITVQGEPNILVNPSPFNYTFNNCIESEIIPFTLYNTGLGELSVDSISFRKQVNTDFKVDYNASPYSSSNFFISPNNIDTILLTIEIIGDYDQVDEYASLEIDGIDYGIIPDYGSNTTYQIKLFGAALANYLTNSVLEVIVTNSPTVSGTPYHKVSIQYNAANEFISVQNIDTTITANDSVNFDITLSTQNMLLGNYLDSILIYSNDIDNSPLSLPISVINNGSAMLSLDKFCIDFDSVFRYGNNILPLSLHNSGCDTLFITNVYTNTSQFQDYDSIITILPFQYYDLEVNFSTNSIGSFLDTLYIESNVLDTSICLSAISIEGPSIEINPDSIYLSITECNDSLIVPITILNNGASTLNLNIENKDSILDVFLWDLNTHQQTTTRTILAINSYFTDYNLLQSSASDSLSFKNLLDGSDVLLIPNRTSYNSFDPVIYDYIKDFVSKGGWLVFAGSNSAYISSFDMISSYTSSSSNFYGIHTVDDPSSTLLSGVDFPLSASNATAYPLISAFPNFRAITSTSGNPLIGELDYNFGKVIYLGCTYGNASLNENSKKIIANSLRWASSSLLNWSSSSLSNASVISNDSLIFNYNFNTTNKVAGQYFSSIDLTSNDPTTPIIQIPVVIDIVAEPQMSFSTNCFNFDSIQSNSTTNYILWIYNEACDTLEISNIVSTDASVSSDSSLIVYPFDSTSLNLTFSPTLNQQYNGDLLFTSNAGDSLVCFSGYAGVAPVYFCDEDSIVVNALCHELFSYPLVIYNNGGSPLNINLLNSLDLTSGNNSDFVSLSTSDSISIPIGDSLIVYVNFDSDSLENGVYDFHYNLKTNDSLVTDTNIYFSYIVNGSPEILFTNYCVDFDTIIQFSDNNYQTILISNPGCDTLIVSDIVSSNDFAYQVDTSFVLLPYSSDSFIIKMSCDNLGMNYDTLTYFTNADADTSICISAFVIETPQISSNTDTLNVVLNSCNDTTDIQFKLYNTGITDLEYKVQNATNEANNPLKVLAWTYDARSYSNTINSLNSYFTDYSKAETNTTHPDSFKMYLDTVDVLLLPTQNWNNAYTISINTLMAPAILDFVEKGGWVIQTGNLPTVINSFGLFNIINGQSNGGVNSNHIATDLNSPILKNNTDTRGDRISFYGNFTNPNINIVATYYGKGFLAERTIGLGRAIYIGVSYEASYGFPNSNVRRMLSNSFEWAKESLINKTVSPNFGIIANGDSALINVQLNSFGKFANEYIDHILINSNDGNTPDFNLPVQLTILGEPEIAFNTSCIIADTTKQHLTSSKQIWVQNFGCDTLFINNISVPNADIAFGDTQLVVDPFDSTLLEVFFTPSLNQFYTENILFESNIADAYLCFEAYVIGAPIIEVIPDSIYHSLNCGDSLVDSILIVNNGFSNLEISLTDVFQEQKNKLNVLVWTYGVSKAPNSNYQKMIHGLRSNFRNYNLIESNSTNIIDIQNILNTVDVAILPFMDNGSSELVAPLRFSFRDFVEDGGWVLQAGNSNDIQMGINYTDNQYHLDPNLNLEYYINDYSSPIVKNVVDTFNYSGYSFMSQFNTGQNYIVKTNEPSLYSANNFVSLKNLFDGKIIYYSPIFEQESIELNTMLGNTFQWAFEELRDTFGFEYNYSIAPGDSLYHTYSINATQVENANYLTDILIETNDPLDTLKTIPINYNVIGNPQFVFNNSNCVNFDSTGINNTSSASFWVYNEGCDVLQINNISSTSPQVSFDNLPIEVYPFDSLEINAYFSPTDFVSYTGQISIQTNDGNSNICFNGEVIESGILTTSIDSISTILACSDSITLPIVLYNETVR